LLKSRGLAQQTEIEKKYVNCLIETGEVVDYTADLWFQDYTGKEYDVEIDGERLGQGHTGRRIWRDTLRNRFFSNKLRHTIIRLGLRSIIGRKKLTDEEIISEINYQTSHQDLHLQTPLNRCLNN
jgi:hypothetical protein